jgi:hypothetical protein
MADLVRINGDELDEDVREGGPKIPVLFLKSASPYTTGEVAGFNERTVENLEDRRVARRLKDPELKKLADVRSKKAAADAERALADVAGAVPTAV